MYRQIKKMVCIGMAGVMLMGVMTFANPVNIEESQAQEVKIQMSGENVQLDKVQKDIEGEAVGYELSVNDKLVCENDKLALYLDEHQLIMKVQDKEKDYIWSTATLPTKLQGMSVEWQRFAQSMLVMDFVTPAGVVKRSALKHGTAKAPTITKEANGFRATVHFFEAEISLDVVVTLEEDGISVEIPDSGIIENGENKVHKLYVMPFFGASYQDENPGYIFIPDGAGALIRYGQSKPYSSSYVGRIYGEDYGVKRPKDQKGDIPQVDTEKAMVPVFGVAQGDKQNAFVGIITQGDTYCEIEASPAGNLIDYFWVAPKFIYHDIYWQTNGSKGGFTTMVPTKNEVNAKVRYHLLSGEEATYVGMAKTYQDYLIDQGDLANKIDGNTEIPIKLDAIMADQTKGLFGNKVQVMTTIQDTQRWVEELSRQEIGNIHLTLTGFEKGGVSGHDLDSFKLEKEMGTEKELKILYEQAKSNQSQVFLQKDIVKGHEHQIKKKDISYNVDGGFISYYRQRPLYSQYYYTNGLSQRKVLENIQKLEPYKKNLSLQGIGNELYSNYKRNEVIPRHEVLGQMKENYEIADEKTEQLLLEKPNGYAFKYGDKVYGIPDSHSKLIFETDSVPFIQIVLSGYVEMFADYMNYGLNTRDDLLKLVDYNMYPSYLLSEEYSNKFAKTNLNDIYSSRYEDWKTYIIESYEYLNPLMKEIKGKKIIDRMIPQDGIAISIYEDGLSMVVNYTLSSYEYRGKVIGPKSASVVRGE